MADDDASSDGAPGQDSRDSSPSTERPAGTTTRTAQDRLEHRREQRRLSMRRCRLRQRLRAQAEADSMRQLFRQREELRARAVQLCGQDDANVVLDFIESSARSYGDTVDVESPNAQLMGFKAKTAKLTPQEAAVKRQKEALSFEITSLQAFIQQNTAQAAAATMLPPPPSHHPSMPLTMPMSMHSFPMMPPPSASRGPPHLPSASATSLTQASQMLMSMGMAPPIPPPMAAFTPAPQIHAPVPTMAAASSISAPVPFGALPPLAAGELAVPAVPHSIGGPSVLVPRAVYAYSAPTGVAGAAGVAVQQGRAPPTGRMFMMSVYGPVYV